MNTNYIQFLRQCVAAAECEREPVLLLDPRRDARREREVLRQAELPYDYRIDAEGQRIIHAVERGTGVSLTLMRSTAGVRGRRSAAVCDAKLILCRALLSVGYTFDAVRTITGVSPTYMSRLLVDFRDRLLGDAAFKRKVRQCSEQL